MKNMYSGGIEPVPKKKGTLYVWISSDNTGIEPV